MVSRVMAVIGSKKHQITSSRLVSSALQSPCKMNGRSGRDQSRRGDVAHEFIDVWPVVQQIVIVLSRGLSVETTPRVTLMYNRCVSMVYNFAEVVVAHVVDDGSGVVTVVNNSILVQHDETKV